LKTCEVIGVVELEAEREKISRDPQQLAIAVQAAGHARVASAAVRYRFIARTDPAAAAPPLARILRGSGGRGGAVRLKLYLSLLWLARGRTDPVFAYPAQQLAGLIGLPSPAGAGARRINESLSWLEEAGFVRLDRRPGDAARVHLLDDAGSGKKYVEPGPLMNRKSKRPAPNREQHYYVRLPKEFWTEGWIAALSGAAIAMYLVVLHEERGREGHRVWIAPSVGTAVYDISAETRGKGLRELVDLDLLDLEHDRVTPGSFDERYRARNVYRLVGNGLNNVTGPSRAERLNDDDFTRPRGSDRADNVF
jgi:hypothetical protein